jgi:hypothetical protein
LKVAHKILINASVQRANSMKIKRCKLKMKLFRNKYVTGREPVFSSD